MSEIFAELSKRPGVRLAAVVVILAMSCLGLVALVATTGYQMTSRLTESFAASDSADHGRNRARSTIQVSSAASENSVAVMPFENLSTDLDNFLFAESVHRQMLEALSEFADIAVVAGNADSETSIVNGVRIVNAKMALTGTVQYEAGTLEVTVQLIDMTTLVTLWKLILNGNALDIFDFQAEIVGGVTNSLGHELTLAQRERIARPLTHSPEAYLAYSKAKALILEGVDGPASVVNRLAVQNLLDEALEFDPDLAEAYAWKALVYSRSKSNGPPYGDAKNGDANENHNALMDHLAQQSALLALERDPALGIAHAVLAGIYMESGQYDEAQIEADKALELSPNYSEVLTLYALVETEIRNRPEQAIPYLERAIALSPNDPQLYAQLGSGMMRAGRLQDAENAFEKCRTIAPNRERCSIG